MTGQQESPSRARHAFQLSTLFIAVAMVGLILALISNWRHQKQEFRHLADAQDYRWIRGQLAGSGTHGGNEVELFLIPDRDPNKWNWILRNETDVIYNLYFQNENIPKTGVPRSTADSRLVQTLIGSCLISIEVNEGKVVYGVCRLDRQGRPSALSSPVIDVLPELDVDSVVGANELAIYAAEQEISLLRLLQIAETPTKGRGILLWLQPIASGRSDLPPAD